MSSTVTIEVKVGKQCLKIEINSLFNVFIGFL